MNFTISMLVSSLRHSDTPEDVFKDLKSQLEAQRTGDDPKEISLHNMVNDTHRALHFFIKQRVIEQAEAETSKKREEIESLIAKMENYSV